MNNMVALHRKLLSLGHSHVNADDWQKVEIVFEPQTDILSVARRRGKTLKTSYQAFSILRSVS